jgi:hypothetical protein
MRCGARGSQQPLTPYSPYSHGRRKARRIPSPEQLSSTYIPTDNTMAIARATAVPSPGIRKPSPIRAARPGSAESSRPRIAFREIAAPFAAAVSLTIILSLYIAGYALVASANYDLVHLKDQLRGVRAENELILTDINNRRCTEAVATWARTNQMVDDGAAPVVIVGGH